MNIKKTLFTAAFSVLIAATTMAQGKKPVKPVAKKPNTVKVGAPVVRASAPGSTKINTENDSLSYAIGVNIGQSFKQQGLESLDVNLMSAAIADVLAGRETKIAIEQCMPLIMSTMQKKQSQKFAPLKAEGEKYLAENKKKTGVITTASGLQYEVIKKGEGAIPTAADRVNVHYHGTTIDGKVFDSSVDRGQPATFGVTQVIQGWVEALQLMPVGSKWKLTIPQALAYADRGAGENIPPFSTLVFEVELLGIEAQPVAAPPAAVEPKN
jgi:FKBP-type peptidyl-prolyl cis-trans isomerase FklB